MKQNTLFCYCHRRLLCCTHEILMKRFLSFTGLRIVEYNLSGLNGPWAQFMGHVRSGSERTCTGSAGVWISWQWTPLNLRCILLNNNKKPYSWIWVDTESAQIDKDAHVRFNTVSTEELDVFQVYLLSVEDAGLLQGVLALGYIPHPDRPIVATGGQQAFLTAPTARDDLWQSRKTLGHKRKHGHTLSQFNKLHYWPCSGEPPAWWRSTSAGPLPCRQRSADGSGCCRGHGQPVCAPAAGRPTGGAARRALTTGSRLPARWPAPEGLQRRDYGKDGHTNAQLDLLDMEHKVTRQPGWVREGTQMKKTQGKTKSTE